ncbi:MAG: SUMF1/EgtB/PvdO family nonheme iron enzyme [Caldilineae bacterium]|nr:SUMF1/EgtB/PvdO family nonheme iron enzyme [Chloroflexota bacterium]MCB9176076.1 SUMF1/EgtB/PvdO family nonheme iron enzyme [Caldilineae bacterium]
MSATAALRLFGSPTIEVGGRPRAVHRKPLALLAYLCVTEERAARETLAQLLWPQAAGDRAGANLRKAIWAIRETLSPDLLDLSSPQDLRIGVGLRSDVARFTALRAGILGHGHPPAEVCTACVAPLQEATRLAHEDFMVGFSLPDSADFDDWQVMHAERLRHEQADLLDRLAACHRASGDLMAAREVAERRLAMDPLHEGACRQMMSLLVWTGDRAAALRHFAELEAALRRDLGVEPSAEILALRDAIRESRLLPPPDRFAPEPGAGPATRLPTLPVAGTRSEPGPASIGGARSRSALLERIDVVEAARDEEPTPLARRGLPRSMARLLAAVLDPGLRVRLEAAEAAAIAGHDPIDLLTYRLGRIAAWSRPDQRLDERFVSLSLWMDQGAEARGGRWQAEAEAEPPGMRETAPRRMRYRDLTALIEARPDPVLVLLGRPGAGKSTLLRRLELDLAAAGIRGDDARVGFYVSLAGYRAAPGEPLEEPLAWLAASWGRRFPQLPALETLLDEGRLLLLLDGLNEMPHEDAATFHERVDRWRRFLVEQLRHRPGVRAIFACRSLDYSAPLSSPELRVPQVRVEPLDDDQVRAFLHAYRPERAEALWSALVDTRRVDLFRVPYLLRLLLELDDDGLPRTDAAALFTGIVRRALRRELERGDPELRPGRLLSERDCRRLTLDAWSGDHALPDEAALIPGLERLAFEMQSSRPAGQGAQVRLGYPQAAELIDDRDAESVLRAGLALGLLDEDLAAAELGFAHQLLQEYFAARRLARRPQPELARRAWRADAVEPSLARVLAELQPSERLPALPASGWEETMVLAAVMSQAPEAFLEQLAQANLGLAARAARALDQGCPEASRQALRALLGMRARDPSADLRARIEAGLCLGELGGPELVSGRGPDGAFLLPSLVRIPAGDYPIGSREPLDYLGRRLDHQTPRHALRLAAFDIGRHPVTNAEWACFMAGGGYEDEAWWDDAAGRRWRRGEGTAEGQRAAVRYWWRRFQADPSIVEGQRESGEFDARKYRLWRQRLAMDGAQLEAHLCEIYPDQRFTEPQLWRDADFNNPAQPVVGVCWLEARAYCRWLAAQSGLPIRLPSEVEWEAAARGAQGRRFAGAERFTAQVGNTMELQIRGTTPVGVFPDGDTPEGVCDLVGNTWDWTASAWGPEVMEPAYRYPYQAADGREATDLSVDVYRVVRGGAWFNGRVSVRSDYRGRDHAFDRTSQHGLRVAASAGP